MKITYDQNKDYYEILGVDSNASTKQIWKAYHKMSDKLMKQSEAAATKEEKERIGKVLEFVNHIKDVLTNEDAREAYDMLRESNLPENTVIEVDVPESSAPADEDDKDDEDEKDADGKDDEPEDDEMPKTKHGTVQKVKKVEDDEKSKKSSDLGKGILTGVGITALITAIIISAYSCGKKQAENNRSASENLYTTEATIGNNDQPTTTPAVEDQTTTSEENEQTTEVAPEVTRAAEYANIEDPDVIEERATALYNELNNAGIINPTTGAAWTKDEIADLILFANGYYIPTSNEDIDQKYLDILNLFISQLNTDQYLYHVVYASGDDSFRTNAEDCESVEVDFATAFAQYGNNGVYVLNEWMQQKKNAIYATTSREEMVAIYNEVGQVMADIMKGNGCTIYIDKTEYHFTSEQLLANPASALLLTTDAQLIFANSLPGLVNTHWNVENKFLSDAEYDVVSYDEINAWINNGCDYEWGIDEAVTQENSYGETVLMDGQTFGQRIQGTLEGMAQNNLEMNKGKSLILTDDDHWVNYN